MWHVLVLVVFVSVSGYYAMRGESRMTAVAHAQGSQLAGEMGVYRQAVVAYFAANPAQHGRIGIDTLNAAGVLPAWSRLATQPGTSIWDNYRDTDGTIYVYAASVPPISIINDIVGLSRNSILTGVYRSGDATLHSPIFGDTGIPLPAASKAAIPHGSPVWVATGP